MLTSLTVKGFKSLQNIENLELGVINVFIGANGSGKTNLLEAIGLLSATADTPGLVDDQALLRRGVRLSPSRLYHSSFKGMKPAEKIQLRAIRQAGPDTAEYQVQMLRLDVRQLWLYERALKFNQQEMELDNRGLEAREWREFSVLEPYHLDRTQLDLFTGVISALSDYAIFTPNTPALRGAVQDMTQRHPVGLAGGRLAEAVEDLLDVEHRGFGRLPLDELFDLLGWVQEIAVVPPSRELVASNVPTTRSIIRFTNRWMSGGNNQLSSHDANEGTLYVLFVLVLALHPGAPRLFAIDNFDYSMHPQLAQATTRLLCEQMLKTRPARQALLTTHNPAVLDGLDLSDERIRLFAVAHDATGATQIHRIDLPEEIIAHGLPLSTLWLAGAFNPPPDSA
jgi:hypothetical protein